MSVHSARRKSGFDFEMQLRAADLTAVIKFRSSGKSAFGVIAELRYAQEIQMSAFQFSNRAAHRFDGFLMNVVAENDVAVARVGDDVVVNLRRRGRGSRIIRINVPADEPVAEFAANEFFLRGRDASAGRTENSGGAPRANRVVNQSLRAFDLLADLVVRQARQVVSRVVVERMIADFVAQAFARDLMQNSNVVSDHRAENEKRRLNAVFS